MSHKQLANLWKEFEGRRDLHLILKESFAQIWLPAGRQWSLAANRIVSYALLCKRLFDYQRICLRTKNPPLNILMSAEDMIRNLECTAALAGTFAHKDFTPLLRRALVSGFRALMFAKSLPSYAQALREHAMKRLEKLLDQWPENEALHSEWTLRLLRQSLRHSLEGGHPPLEGDCKEHPPLDVPDREVFTLIYDMTDCLKAALDCLITPNCQKWHQSAWVLFDARLSLLGTYLDWLNDNRENRHDRLQDTEVIYRKATSLTTLINDHIRKHYIHKDQLAALATVLCEMEPVGPESMDIVEWMSWRDGWPTQGSHLDLQPVYEHLTSFLKERRAIIFDSSQVCDQLSESFTHSLRDWMPQPLSDSGFLQSSHFVSDHMDSLDSRDCLDVYVLHCPELHPIGYQALWDLIDATPSKKGKQDLENRMDFLSLEANCKFHEIPNPPPVFAARRITPIARIFENLGELRISESGPAPSPDQAGVVRSYIDQIALIPVSIDSISQPMPSRSDPSDAVHSETTTQTSNAATSSSECSKGSSQPEPWQPTVPNPQPGDVPIDTLRNVQNGPKQQPPSTTSFIRRNAAAFLRPTKVEAGSTQSSQRSKRRQHRSQRASNARQMPHLAAAISADAEALVVWSPNLLKCWMVTTKQWSSADVWLTDILAAAVGTRHFAVVSQEPQGYLLYLYDRCTGVFIGDRPMNLEERPWSMSFSTDGNRLAVSSQKRMTIISPSDMNWASRGHYIENGLLMPKDENSRRVDSQSTTYSPDGTRVVVATRYYPSGEVDIMAFDSPRSLELPPKARRASEKIHCGVEDRGLASVSCFYHNTELHLVVCAATEYTMELHIITKNESTPSRFMPSSLTGRDRPGGRIQCSVAVPGETPTFMIVDDDDQVFMVSKSGVNWNVERRRVPISRVRPSSDDRLQKLLLSAPSRSEFSMFWISEGKGQLLRWTGGVRSSAIILDISLDIFAAT